MTVAEKIRRAKICPYCGEGPEFMDSALIYGKSYGMVYACIPCGAWVGVHAGTNKPLGRLADATLRKLKNQAHKAFDPIWIADVARGKNRGAARNKAYKWLAGKMGIPREHCHIGMFDEMQCLEAIGICESLNTYNVRT